MLLGERLARRVPEDDEDDFGDGEEQAPAQPWTGKESGRELTQLVRVYGTGECEARSNNVRGADLS